ncbi:putative NUDIX hydrolase [Candidatus Terasakiella magnetica]|uniref:Putative NUDIX hydrolase n=1 Tax=Candidatus Terasakiella magnetica TaxID=1867952 RepID=A0A1C3RLU8_9PROT|nr:CoA pyrophosphatase [Candidatus Terasakiella magnetica]SCA58213.1 putative NUDIX hydrolase [Candidatus Terasakiella magnetica]
MEQQRILSSGTTGRGLSAESLCEILANYHPSPSDIRGDHDLNGFRPKPDNRAAAVLVPIVKHKEGLTVLFTKRTDHLKNHPGQISFPGGHTEEEDESAEHAALRETEEEVGLPHEYIKVIGRLNDYVTRTGFRVTPIIGLVEAPYPTEPDPHEVAEVFEVPLSFLLDRSNHEKCSRIFMGQKRYFWAMPYEDYYIWGATAGMLKNLCDVLDGEVSP